MKWLLTMVLFIAIIIISPIATIYSLNLLFHTDINLNIWTWLAVSWLHSLVYVNVKKG